MTTTITRSREVIHVTEVTDIKVTEVADDGNGNFVRKILIYGSAGVDPVLPALEIFVSGDAETKVRFTTPELDF